jgi:predicted Zn-dependent peptidase
VVLAAALGCTAPFAHTPAWKLPPPETPDRQVVQAANLHRLELDNGLRILVLEDHRVPRVSLGVTVRRGEAINDPSMAGLAPFTAEVMKRGAGDRDALALARSVDEIGAGLAVSAGWDSVTVRVSGLSRDLDRLLEVLADVVLRPTFAGAEARKARRQTLSSLEKAKDDPATLAGWYTARAVFGGHRFGLPQRGTPETVRTLDAGSARAFHERVFMPNNAVLSAVGDVDADALLSRVGAAFGAWRAGTVPEPGTPPPAPAPGARRIVVVDRPDLGQARIAIAHEGIARDDPDRVPAGLMNSVLGGSGFSSRLMKSVRAEAGLTYGVGSGFAMHRQPGSFRVSTFTRAPEARRVVDLLLAELERAREEPPTEAELEAARTLAVGRFALSLETSEAVMSALVELDIYGLPGDSLDTYRSRVRSVDAEDTARMANRLLHPERAAIVLVGPAEVLTPLLEGLGPVEVVTP